MTYTREEKQLQENIHFESFPPIGRGITPTNSDARYHFRGNPDVIIEAELKRRAASMYRWVSGGQFEALSAHNQRLYPTDYTALITHKGQIVDGVLNVWADDVAEWWVWSGGKPLIPTDDPEYIPLCDVADSGKGIEEWSCFLRQFV